MLQSKTIVRFGGIEAIKPPPADAVKQAPRSVGIGYVELVAGDKPAEPRPVV